MQPFWRITLLGSLTLSPFQEANAAGAERNGPGEIRRFRSQKIAALLSYLALHVGHGCSRDVLCEALWPDGDPQDTRNRLRVALSSLRRQLEPPGIPAGAVLDVSVTNAIRLRAGSVRVDVADFETAVANGDVREARALYSGELLPTLYEEWILEARERLNHLAQSLPENLDGSHFSPEVLEASAGKASVEAATVRHQLPLYLTRFFGREPERERIQALLSDGQTRLITLTGAGGQGKTRLSIEAAREQRSRPVWFVALADLWDGSRLAEAIRDATGLPRTSAPALPQVRTFLQEQTQPLLVLDNLEQIAASASPLLTVLLHQIPDLTVIATSRARLEVPGEREIPVSPLLTASSALPPATDRAALARLPAVALFVDRAQSAQPDFQITERNAADIANICQLLEGIPLGLELAAARSASLTPAQMRQRLTEHWNALPATGKTDKADRHQSLRAAIEWSVALLPFEQRRLFVRLSVFQGGATLDAIEAVCETPHALDTLTRLRASSLVLVTESGDGYRYSLLETLRQWAAGQLTPSERDRLAERHVAWFHRFALVRKELFSHRAGIAALDEMEADLSNFRATLAWCRTENPHLFLDLALSLTSFWEHKSHFQEAQAALETALVLSDEAAETEKRVSILVALATHLGRQGDGVAALARLDEARDFGTPLSDTVRASIHWAAGRALWIKGSPQEALAEFQACRRLFESLNDSAGLASTLSNIGVNLRDLGDYEGARGAFTEAIEWSREHDVPHTLATALDNYASLLHILGENGALEIYQESLALKRALGATDGVAITISNLATLYCRQQNWKEGRRLTEESCALLRATGNRRGLATSLNRLGQIADAEGAHDEAKRCFLESLGLRLTIGNPHGIIVSFITFAEHALAQNNAVKAAQILGVAEKQMAEWGFSLPVDEDAEYRQGRSAVQAALSPAAFDRALAEGASWSLPDVVRRLQK